MRGRKFEVVLFQPYLRKHILNFGKQLKHFTFSNIANTSIVGGGYNKLPTFEKEILRVKTHWKNRLRRLLGIPNIRPYFQKRGDVLFTYGCLLLTNKPYCVYIENGTALYNYDTKIALHPIAQLLFSFFVRRNNLKKLIFMSETAQKSFLASVPYSLQTRSIIDQKSIQIYPLIEKKDSVPKKFSVTLKLLFVGMVYIKGGMELSHAFAQIRKKYSNITLTIITALHTIKDTDVEMIKSIPGLTLIDATLDEAQMGTMYQTHDIFVLPTFRDGSPLVLLEALSWGMPIICTDQYATTEVALDGYNAFVYPNHPLKDYDSETYEMLGKYYNPKDFYRDLFKFQRSNQLKPVEEFLMSSIEKFLQNKNLLEKYSRNSLVLYNEKFHQGKLSEKIEGVFLEALGVKN